MAIKAPANGDPRLAWARPDLNRFLALSAQLALLLVVFRVYRVEQFAGDMGFFFMCCLAFAAFAVHYWLPFRWKEKFWLAISLLGALLLLPFWRVALLMTAGGALYLVLASPLSYWKRVSLVASGLAIAMVLRGQPAFFTRLMNNHSLGSFWVLFGALFMFRLIVYVHDIRYMKGRPPLTEFLAYFFILPNYVFLLFPVIDYKTMRLGYYRRDIHEIAQQGIMWMCRGTLQLLAYMLIFYARDMLVVHSFGSLLSMMLLTFLLYLRVSGQFHISVGLLHLFGYDLPETNHKYLLSHSLTDFWRRINIYWKDFMVKVVYFPAYFWLRKKGELRAQVMATGLVFVVTWALHAYQTFWLRGQIVFTWPDTLFWAVLGILMILNVWWDHRHARRRNGSAITLQARGREAVSVLGTG
jgi:D-alanyl-lipoteichoic acid acyltransferase DltB (MBOAT superfamily)